MKQPFTDYCQFEKRKKYEKDNNYSGLIASQISREKQRVDKNGIHMLNTENTIRLKYSEQYDIGTQPEGIRSLLGQYCLNKNSFCDVSILLINYSVVYVKSWCYIYVERRFRARIFIFNHGKVERNGNYTAFRCHFCSPTCSINICTSSNTSSN